MGGARIGFTFGRSVTMASYLQSANSLPAGPDNASKEMRPRGELLYQAMTIAAMLIILVSIWVF